MFSAQTQTHIYIYTRATYTLQEIRDNTDHKSQRQTKQHRTYICQRGIETRQDLPAGTEGKEAPASTPAVAEALKSTSLEGTSRLTLGTSPETATPAAWHGKRAKKCQEKATKSTRKSIGRLRVEGDVHRGRAGRAGAGAVGGKEPSLRRPSKQN